MIQKEKFKTFVKRRNIGILLLFSLLSACSMEEISTDDPRFNIIGEDGSVIEIEDEAGRSNFGYEVFIGQTHMYTAEDENLKLVSNRDALFKLNITSKEKIEKRLVDPKFNIGKFVNVRLTLNGNQETFFMTPPTIIEPINLDPGKIEHSFENSFTFVIDKKWIQPGLKIDIQGGIPEGLYGYELRIGGGSRLFYDLKIGAPNKLFLNMFDLKFFGESSFDYPNGFIEELESKLPVSEIVLRRAEVVFPEVTVQPRANKEAVRISSIEEYENITGVGFEGDQGLMTQLNGSLKGAAGTRAKYSLYLSNAHGLSPGTSPTGIGSSTAFTSIVMVSNQKRNFGTSHGTASHEIGHSFSLPHWANDKHDDVYPYRNKMHGIEAPMTRGDNGVLKKVHVGPVWGIDLKKMLFIPPTKYNQKVRYKKDPMAGGGLGDQEDDFLLNHFSDFSARKMQDFLESKIEVLTTNPGEEARYARWNQNTMDYTNSINRNPSRYAIKQNTEVISVMVGASLLTPDASIAYPPIGPYLSGLPQTFDPRTQEGRTEGERWHCAPNCDISVRVVQGGQTKVRMLDMTMGGIIDPLKWGSYKVRAINFPASDGAITKIEILNTPIVEANGVPVNPEVLDTWVN